VSISSVLKWFLIIALPLTLGSKLLVRPDLSGPSEKDVQQEVAAFLTKQHFNVTQSDQMSEGKIMIRAGTGACHVLVANSNPIAWDGALIRRNARAGDRVFVVFRGVTYKEQPIWLTVPYFLWSRLQRQVGFPVRTAPLLAIIASPSCDAERLPWSELS
jgi:hypothetical protein